MIFAAGLGTRLRPLTDTMPKALVPVGGVPMLERVISRLQKAGIGEFVVNVHHFSGQIKAFLALKGNFGADVDISEEQPEALETGGGIRHAEPCLRGGRFLVHNVDILSDADLGAFISRDREDALASLLVTDAEADRYLLFDDDMRLVGWTNVKTGEVKGPYPGLDVSSCRRLAFCGIHILSDEVFGLMAGWPDSFSIVDFYLSVAATRVIRAVYVPEMRLIDIGSPERLAEADELMSGAEARYFI